jgi:hypothetical protein
MYKEYDFSKICKTKPFWAVLGVHKMRREYFKIGNKELKEPRCSYSPTCSGASAGGHNIGAVTLEDRLPCIAGTGDGDPLDDIGVSVAYINGSKAMRLCVRVGTDLCCSHLESLELRQSVLQVLFWQLRLWGFPLVQGEAWRGLQLRGEARLAQ